MDWNALRNKRTSLSGVSALPKLQQSQASSRFPMASNYSMTSDTYASGMASAELRDSYYVSQHPLFCADWIATGSRDLIALSSFREGFQNRIQVVSGQQRANSADGGAEHDFMGAADLSPGLGGSGSFHGRTGSAHAGSQVGPQIGAPTGAQTDAQVDSAFSPRLAQEETSEPGFSFACVAEASVDYPVTRLQWEPRGHERLAASSEVLRLYKVAHEYGESALAQTHVLANNSTANAGSGRSSVLSGSGGSTSSDAYDINTFPPVTSFDWNTTDPSIIITSSVDTTCTVWDLSRSHAVNKNHASGAASTTQDTAHVKTQLIAHDSEVFDVKFLHMSTNVFASVSNDGSMRVFDLRSLEHSTIIYEPTGPAPPAPMDPVASAASASFPASNPSSTSASLGVHYNPQALLRLSASNADQHHLATVGVNSNQVLIIDLRMPGVPVVTIDGSFDGSSYGAINSIEWHPTANLLATGGDDCQALVWDCSGRTGHRSGPDNKVIIDTPVLAYSEDLEVNNVCWRRDSANWLGVVSGKGFQALEAQ